jgi:sugar lactone lactonase YvrE
MIRRAILVILGVAVGGLAVLVVPLAFSSAPISSEQFDAGALVPIANDPISDSWSRTCVLFGAGDIQGAEELEVDAQGRIYAGTQDGRIVRLTPDGNAAQIETVARPGGRPNGLTFDRMGRLLVSDGYHVPASRISPDGTIEPLPWLEGGDSAVAADGTVYFPSLGSWRRTGHVNTDFGLLMLAERPTGQLRAWHPDSGKVDVLVDGLLIPDGVKLSANEAFVAVNEFSAFRITRYWLRGPKAGTTDRLIENLPGTPDGLASDGSGVFYVSIPMLRSQVLDAINRRPALKNQLAKLLVWTGPRLLGDGPTHQTGLGVVLAIDESGQVTKRYLDPTGVVGTGITTAVPHGNSLWIGSLTGFGVARCAR